MQNRNISIFFAVPTIAALLASPFAALALPVRTNFDPSVIVPDAVFADTQTFGGPEGIQRFLESKGSVLANAAPEFLARLGEPTDPALKAKLDDPQPDLGRLRTAAELIWDAARAGGMNPQVIIVTLHKEQSLIGPVGDARLPKALRNAMGFACPDASGCGDLFPSFYHQLFGNVDTQGNRYLGAVKSLMKSYNTPGGRGPTVGGAPAQVGHAIDIANTLGDYDGVQARQTVIIGNRATAALYRYTPHVFNGNYNFWNFFTSWFRYPNGTLLRSTFDGATFIVNNGQRQRVPQFVAAGRGLDLAKAISASPTEINDYPEGPTYGPKDDTIVVIDGKYSVFRDGIRHPATPFVLGQRKLDALNAAPISSHDVSLFPAGPQLTPADGTVLKAAGSPDVFLVVDGILKKYSEFTFKQHGAAPKLQIIPDDEVALYAKAGWVPPLDGTVIKARAGDSTYLMSAGRRLPLTAELFRNRKYAAKQVVTIANDEEIASIPLGPVATPSEGTYFLMGKEFFIFKDGSKHPIFAFVAKQRKMTPDYSFEPSIAGNWPDGIAIAPQDGTLLKGAGSPGVYVVAKGQSRPLTGDLFKLLKYSFKNVVTVPENEMLALPKGPYAAPPEGTYFSVKDTGAFFRFDAGKKRRIAPFVAKQRGMSPDHGFSAEVADGWEEGLPVQPREGTLLKAEGTQNLFLFTAGQLRPITATAFANRKFSASRVLTVPQKDLDAFERGVTIVK